jgi:hypothetical protein
MPLTCIVCAMPYTAALCWSAFLTPVQPLVIVLALAGAALMLSSYTGANHA